MATGKKTSARIKCVRELQGQIRSGKIADPMNMLNYVPMYTFIRANKDIEDLFTALNFPPRHIFVFDNYKIAQVC